MSGVWVRAELHFPALFSYRVPNTSPSFALASPVPGPLTLKLALVDAAIRYSGSVAVGERLFLSLRGAAVEVEPPERLAVLRFFIRRLKPGKGKAAMQRSVGGREYCHLGGPVTAWVRAPDAAVAEAVALAFRRLGRLGTTDSLASCRGVSLGQAPPLNTVWRPLSAVDPTAWNLRARYVVRLTDLKPTATFDQVNPYGGGRAGAALEERLYILPLVQEDRRENWALYRRVPFECQSGPDGG
ncbi:MAG: hypothetical protein K6T75_06995 [Acetobacteraceae bacterium]|nr:hypothetical protein [Acetobacteraceae bacterium]